MPMIPDKDAKLIREHLSKNLKGPVTIDYFTQGDSSQGLPVRECQYCRETGELLREVSALSAQVTLREHDLVSDAATAQAFAVTRIPAFVLSGKSKGRVRFLGIPSGYEFSSLIEDLVDVSRGTTDLSPKVAEELSAIRKPVHIQVFGTPT